MAGVLVDVLIERLATLALDKVERELKLVVGVKQEIKKLTKKLVAIRAVLEDAEQRQVMEASVKLWLDELNDVSFDMDDVLDEWITRVEKHLLEKQEAQGADVVMATKKTVCFPFPSSCFRFGQVDYKLFLRHEVAKKIEELNERLDEIDENKQRFNFQQNTPRAVPELLQRPKTTSLPNARTFGRDSEKNLIISKLLSENSEESEVPLIVPVVGLGGMGKTCLANLVYNEIKTHFDKSIWVCVSDPFDEIKIAQAIIEELDKDNSSKSSNVLQTLMQCIFDLIKGKKFLLVLDDVWYPKSSQWEEFIKPLHNGAVGSRVLVTTRNEDVATLVNATTELVPLKELGEAFCLSLFYHSAGMVESSVSKEFHDIALEIVKRCNGLPLATKTLGSLMRNKKNNIREWRDVLKSKTWELKEVQQDVFRPLLLSYHDLPLTTKQCLLYCVIFPKDYVYDKNNLVELWMSQDYLNANRSKEKTIVGQNYFDELLMRSFFQDIEIDESNGNIICKIHDIVHEFLQYLTENNYLILDLEMDDSEGKKVPNDQIRHFTLMNATKRDSFHLKCKNLRTLVHINSNSISIDAMVEMIVQLKSLRTLILWQWRNNGLKEIPETIGGLIHLRYLDLSGNDELEELPSAMGSLYNLQTLQLVRCRSLTRIDVQRLINLRHLYVERCSSLRLIKGIEKLTHMQRLDWFNVLDGCDEGGNNLEHLKDMNQLQGSLTIDIHGCPDMVENNAAIMKNKAHILELDLFFGGSEDERQIMNRLEPHPSLEYLAIVRYEGGTFSDWLSSLHSLRVLRLSHCLSCEILPSLGKLASLESLEIWKLHKVSKVGVEFLGIEQGQTSSSSSVFVSFPKLKQLVIDDMESWEEWEEGNYENITIMPFLDQLTIRSCKRLKALPDFLWKKTLQKLNIIGSPILHNLYGQENGEERTKISYIPSIQMQDFLF
ncbi:PREDICTED: putative disease resistance protein RGA3 [Fragaria vesca subsp. vesca]|uniref:putative disease resistance protein RGA3 n=1 Tax=Fragaria vesca subsp. vesca TaxID=101020 RepID=UPI0002C3432F|nr:PREDICTED: putative disease resistance protein RGA3 [Fragaria vesca subsp. vesca]XP_011470021.1 PREDICTED: putative disease resistance protein RGA3 [Fragaria vesca subsp. vesca]